MEEGDAGSDAEFGFGEVGGEGCEVGYREGVG